MLGAAPVARLLFRQAVEPVSLSAGRSWRQLATLVASTDAEVAVADKLKLGLKGPSKIVVKDTSGGCGAMYSIEVVAEDFRCVWCVWALCGLTWAGAPPPSRVWASSEQSRARWRTVACKRAPGMRHVRVDVTGMDCLEAMDGVRLGGNRGACAAHAGKRAGCRTHIPLVSPRLAPLQRSVTAAITYPWPPHPRRVLRRACTPATKQHRPLDGVMLGSCMETCATLGRACNTPVPMPVHRAGGNPS